MIGMISIGLEIAILRTMLRHGLTNPRANINRDIRRFFAQSAYKRRAEIAVTTEVTIEVGRMSRSINENSQAREAYTIVVLTLLMVQLTVHLQKPLVCMTDSDIYGVMCLHLQHRSLLSRLRLAEEEAHVVCRVFVYVYPLHQLYQA